MNDIPAGRPPTWQDLVDEIIRLREALIEAQYARVHFHRLADDRNKQLEQIEKRFGGVIRKERRRLNAKATERRRRAR